MKRGIWIAIAVGLILILIGVTVVIMFVPLGPALDILRGKASLTPTQEVVLISPPTSDPANAAVTALPTNAACGSGITTFLALGESQPPRGADAIRLIRVDFDRKRIDVLSLPADLYVNTPGLAATGTGGATLNQVYLQGKTAASGNDREKMIAAVNLFASTVQSDFGFTPDHYFVIKQDIFSEYIDDLGGLDVVLPLAVNGSGVRMGNFPAGAQHVTGAQALDLVRIPAANNRELFDRQEIVVEAIYETILTPANWDRLPAFIADVHDDILTDLSVNQLLQISCVLKQPGMIVNQTQVEASLLTYNGNVMLPAPGLASYILLTVGK